MSQAAERNMSVMGLAAISAAFLVAFLNTVVAGADWQSVESVREFLKRGYQFFKLEPALLPALVGPALTTVFMALAGTGAGAVAAAGVSWRKGSGRPGSQALRGRLLAFVLSASASVHVVLWGLLAVWSLGPGFVAGIIAIAIRSLHPIARRRLPVSATLPRGDAGGLVKAAIGEFTRNIGRAATLGLVGCGGIGFEFYRRLYTYEFGAAAMVLVVIAALIVASQLMTSRASAWPWRDPVGVDPASAAHTASLASANDGATRWAGPRRLALLGLALGAMLLGTLKLAGLLADAVPAPTAADYPASSGAFVLGLLWSVSETVQMAAVAAVVGLSAAGLARKIMSARTVLLRHVSVAAFRMLGLLTLIAPTMFVALVCRSIAGVGPAAGVIALAVASFGLAALPALADGAMEDTPGDVAPPHPGRHVLAQLAKLFRGIMPAAATVGLFGAGGTGWYLKLAILNGQTAGVVWMLATIAALLVISSPSSARPRSGSVREVQGRTSGVPHHSTPRA